MAMRSAFTFTAPSKKSTLARSSGIQSGRGTVDPRSAEEPIDTDPERTCESSNVLAPPRPEAVLQRADVPLVETGAGGEFGLRESALAAEAVEPVGEVFRMVGHKHSQRARGLNNNGRKTRDPKEAT